MRLFEKPFEEFERGNNILTSPGCQFFGWACWRTGWSSWSSRVVPENWRAMTAPDSTLSMKVSPGAMPLLSRLTL